MIQEVMSKFLSLGKKNALLPITTRNGAKLLHDFFVVVEVTVDCIIERSYARFVACRRIDT